jgi:methyltransferase (TIGR00027 family)
MQEGEASLENISDTALWVAAYRARETARADAVFRDPFADRLAGRRGAEIAERLSPRHKQEWAFTARTYLFDQLIQAALDEGADTVVNLAAGLDARPYRLELPATLKWIEVDLPPLLDYKETELRSDSPRCQLERVPLDLSNRSDRQGLFSRIAAGSTRAVVITEGLVIYLDREEVAELAHDLAMHSPFQSWIVDIVSPGLLRMMERQNGAQLRQAGAPFKFAPAEGLEFYAEHGWTPVEVRSIFKTARRLHRLPFPLNVLALLPEPKRPKPNAIWSGICHMHRISDVTASSPAA